MAVINSITQVPIYGGGFGSQFDQSKGGRFAGWASEYNGKQYKTRSEAEAARNADIAANPDAATSAYDFMGNEAVRAGELQAGAAEQAGQQFTEAADPWRLQGLQALAQQSALMGLGGESPEAQLAALMNSPGYQFRLDQGNQAINRSAAAKGMLGSGNTLAELAKYGQGMASTEYGNRLSQLGNVSTQGMGQANLIGENRGNALIGAANARASGIAGRLDALSKDPQFAGTTNQFGQSLGGGNWQAAAGQTVGSQAWKPGAKWQNNQWV